MFYRREIDGLRAVAVLPVIIFHAGFEVFSGGYVGVDVFFVISGYLITSILIGELERGEFSVARFYERRARRILPALFFVMLACLPFAYFWMLPSQLKDFGQSIVAVVFSASNILFWQEEGYFSASAELKPLLHTWSLAVEEQYYLLFPLLLLLLWRLGRSRVFWIVLSIAILSLLLSEWGWRNEPSANFYLAPSRAWELLGGSICAFLTMGREQRTSNPLSAAGLLLIVFSIFYYDASTPFPSLYALAPVGGTMLIILFAGKTTWVSRLLSTAPFVGIGLISYSAYLWHQPLFAFARLRSVAQPSQLLMAGLAVIAMLLAWGTWRFVEQPFRKGAKSVLVSQRSVFAASAAVGAVFIALGVTAHIGKGFEWRFDMPQHVTQGLSALPRLENGYCFYSIDNTSSLEMGNDALDCYLATGDSSNILLFGDSFAAHWEPFWHEFATEQKFSVHSVTTNWCFPAFSSSFTGPKSSRAAPQCMYNREWLRKSAANYDVIVLSAMWDEVQKKGYSEDVFAAIDALLAESSADIIIMPSPPAINRNDVERLAMGMERDLRIDQERQDNIQKFEDGTQERYSRNDRVKVISKSDLFGDYFDSKGLLTDEGFPYSLDGSHISIYGSLSSYRHFRKTESVAEIVAFAH